MDAILKYAGEFASDGCEILLVFMFGSFIFAIVDYFWVFIIQLLISILLFLFQCFLFENFI